MGVCKVIYKNNTLVDLTGDTVTAQDLRQGVTAHNSNGETVTGAMQEQGTINEEISQVNQVVEIPEGYHSGYGSVEIAGSEQAKIIPENIKEGVNILGVNGSHAEGVDLSNDTITADKLLTGETAHNSQGQQISGTMADRSGTSGSIDSASGSFTIPEGYHDGTGSVAISQSEQAKIIPENIRAGVEVLGVTGSASGEGGGTDTSGDTVTASDLLAGVTAHDASGQQITGTMTNRGGVTGSMSFANDVFAIPQGYHDGTGSVTIDSAEQAKIVAGNIKSGVSILGVTGDYEGEGGSSADTSAIEPYIKNFNSGWAGKGNGLWTYESPSDAYSDIYQVTAEHIYFLSLGANVSTRFRVIFSTVDLSTITSGTLQCTAVNTNKYDDPEPFTNLTFTPSEDGYLVIQKDNTGNNEIKTYLYDKTASWL